MLADERRELEAVDALLKPSYRVYFTQVRKYSTTLSGGHTIASIDTIRARDAAARRVAAAAPAALAARLLSSCAAQPRRLRHRTPHAGTAKRTRSRRRGCAWRTSTSRRSSSSSVVATCRALAANEQVGALAATDMQAWNVALQDRLAQDDVAGARAARARRQLRRG
ncbi:hypothetical protein PybrP1_010093 [[Pythium] brassicae (nom. inval.)]|nr:hypothetical protein PybrP1_010093 [[Pythium] brassicae (nom. inval.)]